MDTCHEETAGKSSDLSLLLSKSIKAQLPNLHGFDYLLQSGIKEASEGRERWGIPQQDRQDMWIKEAHGKSIGDSKIDFGWPLASNRTL